ncbi:hypothetical protein D3C76_1099810 [compost metagenome]
MRRRTWTVIPVALQGAGLHLLEAEREGTFHGSAFHGLAGQIEGTGSRRAVIVDVDHGYAAHADFIERSLAAGGVAIDVSGVSLLDQVVIQIGVLQGLTNGAGPHFDIGSAGARFDERNHADTGNAGFMRHCFSPDSMRRAGCSP